MWLHRRQLTEVAQNDHLHSAKRLAGLFACSSRESIHAVECCGRNHRYFIDDQDISGVDPLSHCGFNTAGQFVDTFIRTRTQPKEAVECLSADIDSSSAGRCDNLDAKSGRSELTDSDCARYRFAGTGPSDTTDVLSLLNCQVDDYFLIAIQCVVMQFWSWRMRWLLEWITGFLHDRIYGIVWILRVLLACGPRLEGVEVARPFPKALRQSVPI
jgi:hypothetical protein